MIPACPAPRAPSRPKVPLPDGACDTHAHVFGPAERFPFADDRSYTPPDAPLAHYLAMLDTLGFARGVLVEGSAHGSDNSAMLDAPYTKVMDGDFVKVIAWYDNEWGYSSRCVDLLLYMAKKGL